MHVNFDSRKYYYDVIDEVCKELAETDTANFSDPNLLFSLREDWISNFEALAVEAKQETQYHSEDFGNSDHGSSFTDYDACDQGNTPEKDSEESLWDEDSDIARAEEHQKTYLVCLFVKVTKCKGKWRCQFKDGFVNIEGFEDHPFNIAHGELEW